MPSQSADRTHRHAAPAGGAVAGDGPRLAVTGSIATDHLATFPGRFTDQLLPGQLDHVSLSFLVDDLEIRHGGVAANIAFGLGRLGLKPLLIGAVGDDFDAYEVWLEGHGVDTEHVRGSSLQTARFMCTTDADQNQIASFYAGAMAEASLIDLMPVLARPGGVELVLVSPNDPGAMLRHTAQCRTAGTPFAADPSQQLARLSRDEVRELVSGARWLFTNEYEAALLLERTGWSRREVLERVGTWLTTRGAAGVRVESGRPAGAVEFPAVPAATTVDPTGGGDAFRAGFLACTTWGLTVHEAVPLGCALATAALESVGPQQYDPRPAELLPRIEATYGATTAKRLLPHLQHLS
ncbi:PfkB family carbohydrate kinase [Streptomyces sp. NPDC012510]|uniref:carbohydrate kinase family protein n=1 Tax=Streptomyces sp. NPDC012510 TaxID=3364838 RepID=UPI0036EAB268